jgi:DNA-binding transcriptional regulator LsrR (DeoR family)
MANEYRENERFLRLQIQAAWLYYMKDLTQQEIATRLGISRVKVTRLIQQARENELVTISINSPATLFFEQQEELVKRYGLQDALVTVSAEDEATLMPILANATASYLSAQLKPGMIIGVGVGRTVSLIPRYFQPQTECNCTFVELSGGPTAFLFDYAQADVIYRLAEKAGGKAVHLKAPFFVENAEAREILLRDPMVSQNLQLARGCDIAIFSVGVFDPESQLIQHGILSRQEVNRLQKSGVIGDVLTHMFDERGVELPSSLSERLIGLNIADLGKLKKCVLIAGGEEKRTCILAALKGKWVDMLITDEKTAGWLIQLDKERGDNVR